MTLTGKWPMTPTAQAMDPPSAGESGDAHMECSLSTFRQERVFASS